MSQPDTKTAFREHIEAFRKELTPATPLENLFADEIIHCAWRLRHCDPDDDRTLTTVHRILKNSITELRRLQTERQIRAELTPEITPIGLADYRALLAASNAKARHELSVRQPGTQDTAAKVIDNPLPPTPENWVRFAENQKTEIEPDAKAIARNAQCPCKSGEKYKRCCGRNAPPLLRKAA
jgi:SEC-C motif